MRRKTGKTEKRYGVLRRVLLVIISLVLGINVYLWNASSLAGNAMPMPFGFGMAVVLSGSMEPVLSVNDLLFIKETEDIRTGDIVVYQNGHELIVHRIISISGDTVQTHGDSNSTPDFAINISSIKGKVIGHVPLVGLVVRALKTPFGVICVLTAAFVLLEFSYRREREKDDKDLEAIKEEIRRLRREQEDEWK